MKPLYNTLSSVPFIPFQIVKTLALSGNENIWKVLYYDDYDCLSKPNLTFKQKMNLIWKNEADEEAYKIFLKPLIASEETKAITQLRINKINMKPTDQYNAMLLYEFAIITGYKIAMIEVDGIPVSRIDYLEQQIIKELNGTQLDLRGLGVLKYDRNMDRFSQTNLSISNSKSFFGSTTVLCVMVANLEEDTCD